MKRWNDHPAGPGLRYCARVEPSQIGYLCSLLEGYEGLGVVRTKDESLGIVEFWISPLMQADFEDFLRSLETEISIVTGPPVIPDLTDLQD